jgi:hypothetical protein
VEQIFKPDLVRLPWSTLLTLACGYAAYYVANVGVRDHHKSIDVIFSTLVFGFFSYFAYAILTVVFAVSITWASALTFAIAIVYGSLWSRLGRPLLEKAFRRSKVTYSDDLPSAWSALSRSRKVATQLTIKLKDGSWVKCDNLDVFSTFPDGPCTLGMKGDVLIYITHTQAPDKDEFIAVDGPSDPAWGAEITYLPADQIVRLDLRRKP